MDLSVLQIVLIVLVTMVAALDQFNFLESLYRPIVVGPIIGWIMGDLTAGLAIGASYELMMIGAMPVGGAQPPNAVIGGVMATVFGISLGLETEQALPLAIPFAFLGQYVVTLVFTAMSPIMQKADAYAMDANTKGIDRLNYLWMFSLSALFGVVVLLGLLFGQGIGETLMNTFPACVWAGLSAAGKMMPAMGFAILLRVMLSRDYLVFMFLGFVLVAYLQLPLLAVAILGIVVAVYDFQINTRTKPSEAVMTDGI